MSIIDLGVGIRRSLHEAYPDIDSDSKAILMAMESGISSKRIGKMRARGLGLYNIGGFLIGRGRLEIASYKGYVWQDLAGERTVRNLEYPFHGTCVNLYIDIDKLSGMEYEDGDVWYDN